jgi:hypothetical protein
MNTMSQKRETCFIIAPIGEDDSETRKRSDKVLKYVIAPVVEELGYQAVRADHISEPGLITSQVIQHVADDKLVVADLSERNPNVFYELALRHALRKPLVQIMAKGEQIPFDVAGMRTIEIDINDLDSVELAKSSLRSQIKAVEENPEAIDTPISFAFDLQHLRQSENPEERSLADVVSAISELRSEVNGLERRISSPENLLPLDYLESALSRGRDPRSDAELDALLESVRFRTAKALESSNGDDRTDSLRRASRGLDDIQMLIRRRRRS